MYYFIKKKDPNNMFERSDITLKTDAVCLETILEEFENFLKACGVQVDGHLDFISEED